ncbi:MAG: aryl-sulfate sulfotransferase [Chitinophagales bacterium]|nr:aryl-sulfate sulfotransferase [Chitinophagales bacterium]
MKKTILLITLACCCFLLQKASAQFEYVYPKNHSTNEFPNTHLILRNGEAIDAQSVTDDKVELTGSKSGKVSAKAVLSTDGKTVCITPAAAFAYTETVSVKVNYGLRTVSGKIIKGTSFDFSIRREMTDQEKNQLQEYLDTHDDDGNLINDPNQQSTYVPAPQVSARSTALPFILIFTNNNPAPGRIFFNRNSGTTPQTSAEIGYGIMESNGDSVFNQTSSGDGINFHVNYNGYLTALRQINGIDTGIIVLDSSYNELEEVHCANGLEPSQHEQLFFPDGTKWFSIYDWVSMNLSGNGGGDATPVNICWIQELDANGNVIFIWRSDQYFTVTDAAPDILLTINATTYDPWHLNSMYLDNDGNMIASFRNMDRVVKINTTNGTIMWQWGGLGSTFNEFVTTNDPNGGFSHEHHVHRIENGHILMFDNGNLQDPVNNLNNKSQPKEYILDEVNHTANCVWYYTHPQVNGFNMFTKNQGSAIRLPNGNTIIGYGLPNKQGLPNGAEIDVNKNIVWEFRFKDSTQYSYRVYKTEWNPVTGIANIKKGVQNLEVFPNPNNGMVQIKTEIPSASNITYTVLNTLGQVVFTRTENYHFQSSPATLDLTGLRKGFYILKVSAGDVKMAGNVMIQ